MSDSPGKVTRQRVSKDAIIAIVCILVLITVIVITVIVAVTVARVKRNANPKYVCILDRQNSKFNIKIPETRVKASAIPKHITRTAVSNRPVIDQLDDFISPEEAQYVINYVKDRFLPSTVVNDEKNRKVSSDERTSSSAFLNTSEDDNDPVLQKIRTTAAKVTGIPESYLEPMQVVKYNHGEYYKDHFDYLNPKSDEVKKGGQRTATVLVYLNSLKEEDGGGTRFTALHYVAQPKVGSALLWHNTTPAGVGDPRTLHAGEPIKNPDVTKYAINIWFRDRPQT